MKALCGGVWILFIVASQVGFSAASQSGHAPPFVAGSASSVRELHIIGTGGGTEQNLRWAAWSEKEHEGMSVRLALLALSPTGVSLLWSDEMPDGYEPEVRLLYNWRYGERPVMALTFQYGAAVQQVELYGLDRNNRPILLCRRMADLIEWRLSPRQGRMLMVAYSRPEGRPVATCYRWNEKRHRLEKTRCR